MLHGEELQQKWSIVMAKNCDQSDLYPMVRSRIYLRMLSPSTYYQRLHIEENKTRDVLTECLPKRVENYASVLYYNDASNTTISRSWSSAATL